MYIKLLILFQAYLGHMNKCFSDAIVAVHHFALLQEYKPLFSCRQWWTFSHSFAALARRDKFDQVSRLRSARFVSKLLS